MIELGLAAEPQLREAMQSEVPESHQGSEFLGRRTVEGEEQYVARLAADE